MTIFKNKKTITLQETQGEWFLNGNLLLLMTSILSLSEYLKSWQDLPQDIKSSDSLNLFNYNIKRHTTLQVTASCVNVLFLM